MSTTTTYLSFLSLWINKNKPPVLEGGFIFILRLRLKLRLRGTFCKKSPLRIPQKLLGGQSESTASEMTD